MRATVLGLTLLVAGGCVGPEKPDLVGRTLEYDFESQVVNDSYRIFVRLPPEYDDESLAGRTFPLVVQLDANLTTLEEFAVTAGFASRLENSGDIPPVIVVGIGTRYDPYTPQRGRMRDFTLPLENPDTLGGAATGGAPAFYQCLRDELLPQLAASYRIGGPERRALFGHSLGGLFSVYALAQSEAARPMFRGYVAASPSLWFDGGTIYRYFDALLARPPPPSGLLFLTAGTLEGPEMNVYADDFAERVAALAPGITLGNVRYPTDHVGSVAPSFRDGLLFMFENGLGWTLVTAFALSSALLAASLGVGLDVDVSAAYGFGSRSAFGGMAGITASEQLWETPGGTGSVDFGFLAGYQAEPYSLLAGTLPEAKVSGATHRFEGLFLVGHSARLLASRRLLISVHLFGGWTHVVLRGALSNDSLGISREFAADSGRLVTGMSLTVGVRITDTVTIAARLIAPFPYAAAVISYLIPTLGISVRL